MTVRVAIPDLVSPSYFPAIAAVELGLFKKEGFDATLELIFPVTRAYQELHDGKWDFIGGASHAPLYAFKDWAGSRILCALSQHMYWFLIVRADLKVKRGDLAAVRGLRIGAAPGPVDGLRRMLTEIGINPDTDVKIGPIPAAAGAGVSFGVSAAKALENGEIDAFWANGMGSDVALKSGIGTLVLDARRGDGPKGAIDYCFSAWVTTEKLIKENPALARASIRAITGAQRALAADPACATPIAKKLFPAAEAEMIADLIRRDAPFYSADVPPNKIASMNRFARDIGLLSKDVAYEQVVATEFSDLWKPA